MPPPGASENASHSPVGDQTTLETWSSSAVTSCGHSLLALTRQTCGMPLRSETNAISAPSGEKLGDQQARMRDIRATASVRSSALGFVELGVITPPPTRNCCWFSKHTKGCRCDTLLTISAQPRSAGTVGRSGLLPHTSPQDSATEQQNSANDR